MGTITRRQSSSTAMNILTATGSLAVLIAGLSYANERVREQLAQILTGHGGTTELGGAVSTIRDVVVRWGGIVHDQSVLYGPLTLFGVAALVLVILMTRVKF